MTERKEIIMADKAEIKKIVLDLGGKKTVDLSPKQAKKLHELLDEIFGTKTTTITYPSPYPVIIERRRMRFYWDYPQPVWTSSGMNVSYSANSQTMTLSA